jgi:hypothetical protein
LNSGPCTCQAGFLSLEPCPQHFFALGIFGIGSYIYVLANLDHDPSVCTSCLTGMTSMHHHTQLLLVEMGVSHTFLPVLALNQWLGL